jgi:hypothetical protein
MNNDKLVTISEDLLDSVSGGGRGHGGGGLIGGLLGLVGGVVHAGVGIVGGVLGALFGRGGRGKGC